MIHGQTYLQHIENVLSHFVASRTNFEVAFPMKESWQKERNIFARMLLKENKGITERRMFKLSGKFNSPNAH